MNFPLLLHSWRDPIAPLEIDVHLNLDIRGDDINGMFLKENIPVGLAEKCVSFHGNSECCVSRVDACGCSLVCRLGVVAMW